MTNVNTGLVSGYVCEVRAAAKAIVETPSSLLGSSDQGKYYHYFMSDQNKFPQAAGRPEEATLDYCGDIALHTYRAPNLPLVFDNSSQTISLGNHSDPLCFLHFNGGAKDYASFETAKLLHGVHCKQVSGKQCL
jgi:hypothetical protein